MPHQPKSLGVLIALVAVLLVAVALIVQTPNSDANNNTNANAHIHAHPNPNAHIHAHPNPNKPVVAGTGMNPTGKPTRVSGPLNLTRLLKDRLSRARMRGHANESELAEAVEQCEQIIQWLESSSDEARSSKPN